MESSIPRIGKNPEDCVLYGKIWNPSRRFWMLVLVEVEMFEVGMRWMHGDL